MAKFSTSHSAVASRVSTDNARDNLRRLSSEAYVRFIAKLDHRARAYEDGLEEPVVHPTNALKADGAHELGDLCHRDREIRGLQDGGAFVNAVCGRDLKRKVISRSPPAPDLA
jgi:hypothetical protein